MVKEEIVKVVDKVKVVELGLAIWEPTAPLPSRNEGVDEGIESGSDDDRVLFWVATAVEDPTVVASKASIVRNASMVNK